MSYFSAARLLVPAISPSPDADYQIVQSSMTNGLPHFIDLSKSLRLKFTMPTGLMQTWLDADPSDLVATSDDEISSRSATLTDPVGAVSRPPFRVSVFQSGAFTGSCPASTGVVRTLPDIGDPFQGTTLNLVLLSWDIYAGTMKGPGDFGSAISFAWQMANTAVNDFGPPIINVHLWQRLLPTLKLNSELGRVTLLLDTRFTTRRYALNVSV